MGVTLTVFFEEPFYVGLFERVEDGALSVAKQVFGAEPSDRAVHEFLLADYFALRFSPAVDGAREKPIASNPKRRQRQAASAGASATGTKSQQAMAMLRDQCKTERQIRSKAMREEEAARQFALRTEKRKEKHRGH